MTAELAELTVELRATKEMLGRILERLDESDRQARRHRAWIRVQGLTIVAVIGLGAWFATNASHERDRICKTMRSGFEQYTEALVAVSSAPREGEPEPTPKEKARRDLQIEQFKQESASRLAACE